MKYIGLVFLTVVTCGLNAQDRVWEKYKTDVLSHQKETMGWCCYEKADSIMELVHTVKPKICVEIGVFGGSSIYPFASALKYEKAGIIYAIDPWSNEECLEGYQSDDPNFEWWSKIDLEEVYQAFLRMLLQYRLKPYCKPLRMSSETALSHFQDESIDILHIDGNHTEVVVLKDVKLYLPKVKKGGYIYFDDASWSTAVDGATMTSSLTYLRTYCDQVPGSTVGDCLLFKKKD